MSMENRYETVTDELGKSVTSHFDRWGQLVAAVADSGGTDETTTRFEYDGLGRLIRSTAPLGDVTTYAYDVHGDMVSKTQPDAGTTRYKYDSRHNVRFSQDAQQAAGGKVSYFSYDPFSRMIRSGEVARAFASLDANRAYAFETGAASWTSRYIYDIDDVYDIDDIDDAGESGAAAFWPVGRPVRIEQNTDADAAAEVTARVAYDREGRVTRRRVAIEGLPDKDVFYSYDLAGKVTAMVYPDGGEVHAADERLAKVANGVVSYYLKDHLGSTRTLLSSSGTTLATYDYWPYGEVLATGGTDSAPFKFTGHERDAESGLDFLPNRTYGPVAHRFWQVDPLAHKLPSWSPYVYSFNNPAIYRDPTGAIPYPITIRSFAPWGYFGGIFHGDGENRGFTTSLSATARIHQKINFDTDKTTLEATTWSSPSSIQLIGLSLTGIPSISTEGLRISRNDDSRTFEFGTHAYGSVPWLLGHGPNIDVFSDFTITESDGLLSISGSLKGDNFPATEAFITDPIGQNVFIGVGVSKGNPWTRLRGENRRDVSSFDFGITTDRDGNFTGVRYNGKDYSLSEWNRRFEQKDPEQDDE